VTQKLSYVKYMY